MEPRSGEFFGITAPGSALIPHSLVHVDPATGQVTLIGDMGVNGSDISFDGDTLYVWIPETSQAGQVDLKTGTVTKARGAARAPGAEGRLRHPEGQGAHRLDRRQGNPGDDRPARAAR